MLVASFYAPREKRWGCDYDELLILVDKSCKKFGLRHLVISDSFRPKPLETFLTKLPENLMEAVTYGQMQLLKDNPNESVLLTGADCLLTRDPKFLDYLQETDIAITIGPFSDCVMNTGLVFCLNTVKCWPLWERALEFKPRIWGEDQTSLYKAILEAEEKNQIKVKRLRCEEYNWAPNDINDKAYMPLICHFRGTRKSFMAQWAKNFLGIDYAN